MTDQPYRIAFLIYPGMTQLDFTGPAEVLARMPGAEIATVWTSTDPVRSDNGITFLPSAALSDGTRYDMLCVPGGYACTDLMADPVILDWLRDQAETADLITSVCTGSLVLAAAGLLDGYKAGCHWAWAEHLSKFGATPVRERVVIDRNRITAGGVTAGIDFGFKIIEKKHGRDAAEMLQLGIEYDPEPLAGGVPETARPEVLAQMKAMMSDRMPSRMDAIDAAAATYSAQ